MTSETMTNENTIQAIIENWARAVESGDRKAILANHAEDLLMYDFSN